MKKEEALRELSTSDLIERLEGETLQLMKLRLNHAVNPLDNPNTLKAYRKSIARIKTELRRREIENIK
ncbi:MAG: 50S ribosomal protein L29 [Bacteroidales bacterium]|jgi:large subunit ribosomal protein L29|nr:50S ribosomal protein L29 [Bacteroidales bacterium]